nr:hypothetical protein [Methylobacterium sp. ZNC0032]
MNSPDRFFVTLILKDGETAGHSVSFNEESASKPTKKSQDPPSGTTSPKTPELNFKNVISDFISVMDTYRRFIPMTMSLAPHLSNVIAEKGIHDFARERGKSRPDISTTERLVYELDIDHMREFAIRQDQTIAAIEGAKHLPEVMIIGLISAYDAFLSKLLHVVIRQHEELILTSDKNIKFSELSKYTSIMDARNDLISREVEAVIRQSHHEQFSWMERNFSIKLKEGLESWSKFVELCERRNLLTHTGGIVSTQYINNCSAHGHQPSGINIGDKLKISRKYFSNSVDLIYEIGIKLGHVLWRKFAKAEREDADSALNELAFELIFSRAYPLAESLLLFGTSTIKTHSNDRIKRMMTINLANAIRLQGRTEIANKIIDREDWSATSDDFQICAAAAKGNTKSVAEMMTKSDKSGTITSQNYRMWPIFRGMRTDPIFVNAFQATFGEPVKRLSSVTLANSNETRSESSDSNQANS